MNFAKRRITIGGDREVSLVPDILARVSDSWLEDEDGERIENVEVGQPIRLRARIEARQDLAEPAFGVQFNNADGVEIFGLDGELGEDGESLRVGRQATIGANLENPLRPGRYTVIAWVAVTREEGEAAHHTMKLLEFRRLRCQRRRRGGRLRPR